MNSYLVFDCYQTLIYKKDLEQTVQNFLKSHGGLEISLDFLKYAYDIIYHRYKYQHHRFDTPESRREFYRKYNQELLAIIGYEISDELALELNEELKKTNFSAFADARPILEHFKKKKYPMGLLARWSSTLQSVLENLKLDHYFAFIHSSHDLMLDKPDLKLFTESLKDVLGKHEKIYYIGDDYELDVIPARKVGLIPILLDRSRHYPKKVDCIKINTLGKLKKIIT